MTEILPLTAVIGFGGTVPNGLIVHPDGDTVIYPLGSTVVLRSKKNASDQQFLRGHSHEVSCISLSRSGRYLASGQKTFMGFTADIIIWDLETKQIHKKLRLHKVMVQALDFSHDEAKLASLGGPDDGSLVLWDVSSGEAVCGSPAHNQFVECVKFLNHDSTRIITAGQGNMSIWEYQASINKLKSTAMELGKLVRYFNSIAVSAADDFVYAGTKSGDLMQINLKRNILRCTGPKKALPGGITACATLPGSTAIVIGTGNGCLGLMRVPEESQGKKVVQHMAMVSSVVLDGSITSISIDASGPGGQNAILLYVGTSTGNIYQAIVDLRDGSISQQLVQSAHSAGVTAVAFPELYGEVFATSTFGEIRLWHIHTCRELLRIKVPNVACHCIAFSADGGAVISGWSDGKIRAFGPQSGKLLYTIEAHHKGVRSIAATKDPQRMISGGDDGIVRVWQVSSAGSIVMLATMKDHKSAVNAIAVSPRTGSEAVSASSDGCCIIWDLVTLKRRTSFYSNTFFKSVAYYPDESQIVTTGTDRKIAYWDAYDGSAVRVVDASEDSAICDVHVDCEGVALVSGSVDSRVLVWGYDEGFCYYTGVGHSGAVNRVRVSPDRTAIVSVGSEGGIFIWKYLKPSVDALTA